MSADVHTPAPRPTARTWWWHPSGIKTAPVGPEAATWWWHPSGIKAHPDTQI